MTRREKFIEVFGRYAYLNVIESNELPCASNAEDCGKCEFFGESDTLCRTHWWNSEYKGVDNGKEETESK